LFRGGIAEISAAVLALAVLPVSLYLAYAAVRTLGKQWSLAARLVQDHDLVQEGPYDLVRHPIYSSMFGMLIGTAIAVSSWQTLLVGSAVFLLGTALRIHAEERLLVAAFGDAYRSYALRVPALIPWSRLPGQAVGTQEPR
jgi:protein-S-isoprenylcysteine O-methyltransferase Ste14